MDNTITNTPLKTTTPRFNIIMAIVTTLILILIFAYPATHFFTKDAAIPPSILKPEQLKGFSLTQSPVEVGIYIKNFQDFDVTKGEFTIDATVWFLFDPRTVSLARIGEFTFERAEINKKSAATTEIRGAHLLAEYEVRVNFQLPLNFSLFPFDDHRLIFTLINPSFAPYEVIFTSSRNNLLVNPEMSIEGWTFIDKTVETGYVENRVNPQASQEEYTPRAIFALDFKRTGVRHIISIILPLLVIFFVGFFTFTFDPKTNKKYDVVNMSVTLITALIAYRFVIEALSPQAGYFMFSDYIFLAFLVAIAAILVSNIFYEQATKNTKIIITIILHLLIIGLFFYFIAPWR